MTSFLSSVRGKPSFSRGNGSKADTTAKLPLLSKTAPATPPPDNDSTSKSTTTTTTKTIPLLTLNTDPNALAGAMPPPAYSAWSPQSALEPTSAVSWTGSITPTTTTITTATTTPAPRPRASSSSKPEVTTQRFMPLDFNVYSAPSKRRFSSTAMTTTTTTNTSSSSLSPGTFSPVLAKLTNPFSSTSATPSTPIFSATSSSSTAAIKVPEPTHHLGPHRKDPLFALTERHNALRLGPSAPFLTLHDGLRGSDAPLGTVVNAYSVVAAEEKARLERERAKAAKKELKSMSKEDKARDKERAKEDKEKKKKERRDAVEALELQRSRSAEVARSFGGSGSSSDGNGNGVVAAAKSQETLGTGFWDAYTISVMAYAGDVGGLFVTETLRAVHVGTKFEPRVVLRFSMDAASAWAPDSKEMLLVTRARKAREPDQAASGGGGGAAAAGGGSEKGHGEEAGKREHLVALPRQEFEWFESFTPVPGPGFEPQSEGWKLVPLLPSSSGGCGTDGKKRGHPLAACVPNSRSRSKALRFEFVGKGRVARKYGVSWELMAIMTGMTVCHRLAEISGSVG